MNEKMTEKQENQRAGLVALLFMGIGVVAYKVLGFVAHFVKLAITGKTE